MLIPDRLVLVALGSNQGDSRALMTQAFDALRCLAQRHFVASSIWRSSPVECPAGSPDFLNAVCRWEAAADQTAEALLDQLQALERAFGRTGKRVLNEPRPLDLDLLAFGSVRSDTPRLTLPHPRAHLRRFVLGPLHEIAPDLRLPGWEGSVAETLHALGASGGIAERLTS